MDYTINQWNELVWNLNLVDCRLERFLKEKKITKKKYREYKRVVDKDWIRIWEFHPNQHPELTKVFKKNFE